eukprot:scaffold275056_cov35-Tisochrysis_lutea.AAC.2
MGRAGSAVSHDSVPARRTRTSAPRHSRGAHLERNERGSNRQRWRPLILQDVQADGARLGRDVGMPHARDELHLYTGQRLNTCGGRLCAAGFVYEHVSTLTNHLGWYKWVLGGQLDVHLEDTSLVWRADGPLDLTRPMENIGLLCTAGVLGLRVRPPREVTLACAERRAGVRTSTRSAKRTSVFISGSFLHSFSSCIAETVGVREEAAAVGRYRVSRPCPATFALRRQCACPHPPNFNSLLDPFALSLACPP